ncbi:MAG: MBL fold metallo-hydrolase, partial [Pseudomonadota bacterium]
MPVCEIMTDLFFIERGYLNGNHLVYRGQEPTLIDTAYMSCFEETATAISSLGTDLSDVRLIINTHCHSDHTGGNKIIQEKSGCDIALHKIGKHFIDCRDDWSTLWRYYNHKAAFFNCTSALEEDDVLYIGPHKFRVLHTPGHSPDGIALYNAEEKVLIAGDTLWEEGFPAPQIHVNGSGALFSLQKSLQKLEALDVKAVYPGHGQPFTDFGHALSQCKEKLLKCMKNPELLGSDVLKKITIFAIMEKSPVEEEVLFSYLMSSHGFKEMVEVYFAGEYEGKFNET